MSEYLAFNNDPALAEMVRAQVAAHTKADEIIQGAYWENGKGCFIGCIAHSDSALTVRDLTGFPIALTRVAEGIFEGLPNDIAKGFPERIVSAPRIGANLDLVLWKFLHWCVSDTLEKYGTKEVKEGCNKAISMLSDRANGVVVPDAAADAARADDAAAYAAYSAAYAAYAARAARIEQADKLIELLKAA